MSPSANDEHAGRLLRVVAPHFVAGLTADQDGRILRCAPVLGWCRRRGLQAALDYFASKKGISVAWLD
jgi:hypothetical protein